jgi:hypothetical protein
MRPAEYGKLVGNLTVIDVMDTCSKTIPSLGGGEPLIVRLALTE